MLTFKRFAAVTCLLLLFTTSVMFFAPTSAFQQTSLKAKAETLLQIFTSVQTTLLDTFDRFTSQGVEIPAEVVTKYTEGVVLGDEASNLLGEANYRVASLKTIEALQRFRTAWSLANGILTDLPSESQVMAARVIRLKATINQTYEYIRKIEALFLNANAEGYRLPAIAKWLIEIRTRLDTAMEKLNDLNIADAAEEIVAAESILDELKTRLGELITTVKTARTEAFLGTTERRVTTLKTNITNSAEIPGDVKNASLTALTDAETSLLNARAFLANKMFVETVNELIAAKRSEEEAIKALATADVTLDLSSLHET